MKSKEMLLRYTHPLLFCTLILMHGLGDAVHDDHQIESAEVGLFTMDELLSFHIGKKLPIFFPIRDLSIYPPFFLPKKLSQIISFSTSQAPTIFSFFSVQPSSPRGKLFFRTLKTCESIGETETGTKICATSLDSIHGFVKKAFGSTEFDDFKFVTTTHPNITTPIFQNYTVLEPPTEIKSVKKVPCHPIPYFYAVYFCHKDPDYSIRAFKLPLVGDRSGDEVEAVVVCHLDTKSLSSKHIAFQMLGIEKGNSFCHVFRQGDIVWIQNQTSGFAVM